MEKCLREISRAPCGQVTTDDYNGSWEYRAKSDVKWTVHSGAHTFGASPGRELQSAAMGTRRTQDQEDLFA